MDYKKIDLISEILDVTLNIKCICIKYLHNDIDSLKNLIPPIFSINENEFNRFLNVLLDTKEKHVYFIEDFMFSNYIIICLNKKENNYLFIGPYLCTDNQYNLLADLKDYNISYIDLESIKKYYNSIPFISKSKIVSIISVIKDNIYDKNTNLKFIFKSNLSKNKSDIGKGKSNEIYFESLNYKYIEELYALEQKLLLCVKSGSKVNSSKVLDKILNLYFIDGSNYSLRNCKNRLIYYNTLLSKTVQSSGVSKIYTERLLKMYLEKIELVNHITDAKNIFNMMVIDYCLAISEFNIKHFSALIGNVINYIHSNIQENLSVNEIANLFYVSPTYLSRVFKKETGMSLIDYINQLKIKHSTFLLRDTYLPIQDIGRILGINDTNYFSRLFKKYMNETPTQYRKNSKIKK